MEKLIIAILLIGSAGCATLTEDAMAPIAISFSDGSNGNCKMQNAK